MRRCWFGLLALAGLMLLTPGVAGACAALFSPDASVLQSAQRIIFTVDDRERRVTAYVQVNYSGAAEDFAWVVPLPSNPEVAVIEPDIFAEIEPTTTPQYLFPERPDCFAWPSLGGGVGSPEGAVGGAAPGNVEVYQQGAVGPYDFSVVGGDDAEALTRWLRDNGYQITAPMEPLIKLYTDERMLFLAMRLQGDKDTQDIQPVKMSFSAEQPVIPLRLAAVGAQPDTRVLVWIFGAGQAAPTNLQRLLIPDDQVVLTSFSGADNYAELRRAALEAVDGQGFVVEYAQPTSALAAESALLGELAGRYPYLTRLYGTFSPEQMRVDPAFAMSEQLADLAPIHDLRDRVNPYRCSSGSVLPAAEQAVRASSPQGFWIAYRWLALPGLGIVIVGGIIAALRRRRLA